MINSRKNVSEMRHLPTRPPPQEILRTMRGNLPYHKACDKRDKLGSVTQLKTEYNFMNLNMIGNKQGEHIKLVMLLDSGQRGMI